MDSLKLANDIISNIGGKKNIINVVHCATRLRFQLKDSSIANTEKIKALEGVMSVVISGGQYQVVIGDKVNDVFDKIIDIIGETNSRNKEGWDRKKVKENWFNHFIDIIVGIISPFIGILAAAGIIKGILAMSTAFNWLKSTDPTYILLYAVGDSLFYFLPILVGFSAGKKFNGNPFIPAVIGGALIYPTIVNAVNAGKSLSFFGVPVILVNYTSSLFPTILAAWLAVKLEKWLDKKLHASLRLIFTPLITLTVTGILTFLIVGPILHEVSQQLANITLGLYNLAPVIAGIILGGLWQLIVLLGLHYAFIPVLINNITTLHYDPINAILSVTVFAQAGAALGVFLKAKNKKVREVAGSATVSAMLGITEPALYGVSVPYKKPFIMAGIAGGIGGAITALMKAKMYGFGANAIFAAPLFINPKGIDSSFYAYFISSGVALFGTAILTYLFGYRDKENKESTYSESLTHVPVEKKNNSVNVYNIIKGKIIPLTEVKDKVFSSGVMGFGFAIVPEDNKVYAPFDGTVTTVFKTKHAIGLKSNDGVELLVHMGLDTVELNGEPFDVKVHENDIIKKGQLIAEVNWEFIRNKNYDITTPIVVTNSAGYNSVYLLNDKNIDAKVGDLILSLAK
ncbi:MAG: beta-glucoside system component [Thermoanaerobacterium sp.]|nr:beta-glucoside system component [Thermoanaerobacterium sp.]